MIIKSLYLKNIRSYIEQEFRFREGMTLLSGDIGSGKSSVLLSVEFALFGLIRGSINGASLLRHGCREGLVRLVFVLDKTEFVVERSLKRSSSGISQDACSLSINGNKESLSTLELKAKILSVLGYPDDLISKSKTLIFRYTVYTPQEEMKQIIFESKDDRLEKLRRIFGVDKYELVKSNASLYAKDLRSYLKVFSSVVNDNVFLKDKIKDLRTELNLLFEDKDSLVKDLKDYYDFEKEIKNKVKGFEDKVLVVNELKSKNNVLVNEINSLIKNVKELDDDLKRDEDSVLLKEKSLKKPIEQKKDLEKINFELDSLKKERELKDKELSSQMTSFGIVKNKIKEIKAENSGIDHLVKCPTCKQEVSDEHKASIKKLEEETLKKLLDEQNILVKKVETLETEKNLLIKRGTALELEKEEATKQLYNLKLYEQNIKVISEIRERISLKKTKRVDSSKLIELKKKDLFKIKEELDSFKDLQEEIKSIKVEQEALNEKIKVEEKKLTTIEQSIKFKEQILKDKTVEIEKLEKQLKELDKIRTLEQWLVNHFVGLVSIIEKQFLSKIHREFDALFKEWFSLLIEDSELEANIDQDFSISISQNGYDSALENLSGGEKTAVSLAYRLALNKVINDLVHNVKTKQLLILDEPTDGFSSEQLDKVRDVLEKTNTRQIIIVSHEAKLESFVQNIIRINKNNHESNTLQM